MRRLRIAHALPSLYLLEAQHNQLTELRLPEGCQELFFLDLKGNQLQQLTAAGELPKLHTLFLEENQLSELPPDFLAPYPQLRRLRLDGNPLHESILSNISDDSFKTLTSVQHYLQDLEGGTTLDAEAKVLLLGNGKAGKSCLVERLVHDRFVEDWDSTHGIVLKRYPRKDDPRDNLVAPYLLNLWDFGGQDIYHATHRLFMQANALYLILWNWETHPQRKAYTYLIENGEERPYPNHQVDYWLSYAQTLGDGSPVIVVQTCVGTDDEQEPEGIRKRHKHAFPFFRFAYVESKNPDWNANGYEELMVHVKQAVKKIKGKRDIPTYWADIRTEIRRRQQAGEKQLDLEDFHQLAKQVAEPMDVLTWLTQSGVVFYQQGLFNDQIILDQQWAIDAIYVLFDREKFYYLHLEKGKGTFTGNDLSYIWNDNALQEGKEAYTQAEQELFVSFMLSCELCFEHTPEDRHHHSIPFAERSFVAPQMLPPKPDAHERIWNNTAPLYWRFQHQFLHQGVILRFIVRAQRLAKEVPEIKVEAMWKTGILLTKGAHMVQVEAAQHQLLVKATPNTRPLLALIRQELNDIQGEKVEEYVSADGEKFVLLSKLEEVLKETENRQVSCSEGGYVDVEPLRVFVEGKQAGSYRDHSEFLEAEMHAYLHSKTPSLPMTHSIKQLVAQGNIEKALKLLEQSLAAEEQTQLIMLQSRYHHLKEQEMMGTLTNEQAQIEINRIVQSLLHLASKVEGDVLASPASPPSPELPTKAQVYFSYSWSDLPEAEAASSGVVERLQTALVADSIEVIRDSNNLSYGGLISEFMKELGKASLIVIFISDAYVRSPYCMYELYEIGRTSKWERQTFSERILPVLLESMKLDDPLVLDGYFDHWEQEKEKWSKFMQRRLQNATPAQSRRYHIVQEIQQQFGRLADWLADIHASSLQLLSENDFQLVKDTILKRLG